MPIRNRSRTNSGSTKQVSTWLTNLQAIVFDIVTGLIAHYKMNDNTPTLDVIDSAPTNYTATATRDTEDMATTGKINGALEFNGTSDEISFSSSPTGVKSISFWIKPDNFTGNGTYLMMGNSVWASNQWNWAVSQLGNGYITFWTDGPNSINYPDTDTTTGVWRHYTVILDDGLGNSKIYKNGSLVSTLNANTSGTDGVFRMNGTNSQFIQASLDDVRIYNRVLSELDVAELYNGTAGTESEDGNMGKGLIAHYPMNDNSASTGVFNTIGTNTGTAVQNSILMATSKLNGALSFNGSSDDIDIGTYMSSLTNFTIAGWFRFDPGCADGAGIISDTTNGGARMLWRYAKTGGGSGLVYFGTGSGMAMWQIPDDGIWRHIVLTWDGSTFLGYEDTTVKMTETPGITAIVIPTTLTVGLDVGTGYMTGAIDDLRIYNSALSASDIALLYNQGNATESQNLNQVAHYKCNDTDGTTVLDSSGNGNTGTGTYTDTTGKIGGALEFNGTSDYVNLADGPLVSGLASLSVSGWFKFNSGGAEQVIYSEDGFGGSEFIVNVEADNRARFGIYNSGWNFIYSDSALSVGQWYHFAIKKDSGGMSMYIDGVLQTDTDAFSGYPSDTILHSTTGSIYRDPAAGGYTGFFDGLVDDVRVYNTALDQSEIDAIYNSGTGTENDDPTLVAHYTMNDNLPTTDVLDSSGNGNNGTATQNTNLMTTAKVGGALGFDEANTDYVTIPTMGLGNTAFTYSVWIKPTDLSGGSGGQKIFFNGNAENSSFLQIDASNNWGFSIYNDGNGGEYLTGSTIVVNEWILLTATYDGTTATIYENGAYKTSTAVTPPDVGGGGLVLGRFVGGYPAYYTGYMDDVRIYNRALSPSDILAIYNAGFGTEQP